MGSDAASPGNPPGRRARPDNANRPDDADNADGPDVSTRPGADHLSTQRRNLLFGLGLGVVNVAVLRRLGIARDVEAAPSSSTASAPLPSTITPSGPVVATPAVPVEEITLPPPLDGAPGQPPQGHRFQLAITGGRVIDPDSRFDGLANVGIDDGVITAITTETLQAETIIDATDRVVAPGFIDLLSYEPNPFGVWLKLADGVTTNLAMHGVNNYAAAFFRRYENVTPIHFGGAFHHHFLRGFDVAADIGDELSSLQLSSLEALVRSNLAQGFAGLSFSPEYSPGTTTDEMVQLAGLGASRGHVSFFHVRHSDPNPPGTSIEAIDEVLNIARSTGAAVHIEHLTSTGGTFVMAQALERLNQARAEGVDVTACIYPYDFWGTALGSTRFAPGWQERYGLSEGDLQVAGTSTRLTPETFAVAVRNNTLVAALGSIPEEEVRLALAEPWMLVGSDAIITASQNNHPRGAGTFARTLGRYVRELGVLNLMDALAKLTILPARRVESMIPAMGAKGRVQRGADADLVVFDPVTIADQATVEEPSLPSTGIDHVLVAGQHALRDGTPDRSVVAGTALRGRF